jgi:hypothetical protein
MGSKKKNKNLLLVLIASILSGFAVAFWLFYEPLEFIYTFF